MSTKKRTLLITMFLFLILTGITFWLLIVRIKEENIFLKVTPHYSYDVEEQYVLIKNNYNNLDVFIAYTFNKDDDKLILMPKEYYAYYKVLKDPVNIQTVLVNNNRIKVYKYSNDLYIKLSSVQNKTVRKNISIDLVVNLSDVK